jgi:hypothetical protein
LLHRSADLPGPTDGSSAAPEQSSISSISWDPTGNRLAVLLKAPHAAAGTVALYSTSFTPVVTCNLIGYVSPGAGDAGGKPLQAVFAPVPGKPEAAALLSVGQAASSEAGAAEEVARVANVPVYF